MGQESTFTTKVFLIRSFIVILFAMTTCFQFAKLFEDMLDQISYNRVMLAFWIKLIQPETAAQASRPT